MPFDKKKFLDAIPNHQDVRPPLFVGYMYPNGYLGTQPEEHALFYYYVHARRIYEDNILNSPIVYEGDKDPEWNFRQLFESVAGMYDCNPDSMSRAWDVVDKQAIALGLPLLPFEYQYRFDNKLLNS